MKFDVDNWDYFKNVIIKHRIVIITIIVICLLFGLFFSIKNSFVYVAKTSMVFGRIKPQGQVVSSVVQNNTEESENQEGGNSLEIETSSTEDENNTEDVTANSSPEQNISLSNINIDSNTLKTCQALIISDNLMDKLKSKLELDESTKSIKKSISISKLKSSNVLVITVENDDSNKACDISNAMAQIFSEEVKNIYSLDKVYIIDSADVNDVERTGFSVWQIILWLFIGILVSVLYIAIRQLNVVNMNITKLIQFINSKIEIIKNIISSKIHKTEIRELPSGEELDENYKVINNKSIIDSDLVHSDQPSIDNDISTDIEEFNSKTDTYDDSVASIPITDEKVEENNPEKGGIGEEKTKSLSEKGAEIKDEVLKKIKSKTKKDDTKINVDIITDNPPEKKASKKIGKEEAMSIKAQEELIALREENNQKIKDDRNKIDSQAQIQKRLNEEIEARKQLEIQLELQKKILEQERIQMEEKIKKELKKQLLEEQRKTLEEEERMAYEIEMREQEEEQRLMEEERLRMLREKEEKKEQLKQEKMEKRIIRAEIRQKKAEERAKQRIIAREERNRIQAIKREEKQKLREQKEAERQEIIRKYYEEKNSKEIANQTQVESMSIDNTPKEEVDKIEENKINNYSAIKRIKDKSNGNKDFSEDYIQDNLYPKFKL